MDSTTKEKWDCEWHSNNPIFTKNRKHMFHIQLYSTMMTAKNTTTNIKFTHWGISTKALENPTNSGKVFSC